ncbi:DUF6515 family protein [Winogradskyella sp.]|uniref:DUF6515 family protein n=1 Tax=Winogradskyella sp. TaxID=1883156 RepID=UPI0037048D4B
MKYLTYTLVFVFSLSFNSCARRVIVKQPTSVTVVKKLPQQYKIVKIKGKRYYYSNGKHYRKTNRGYVFVKI